MKIISWNAQGAFRNKFEDIVNLNPDILVVIECESLAKIPTHKMNPNPSNSYWYSDTGKKGIAIFTFGDFDFNILPIHNPVFRYILPLHVKSPTSEFILFAVWAMDHDYDPLSRYIGQIWNAINFYKCIFHHDCIVIGDFNSNKIWDGKARSGNHSSVVNFLETYGLVSAYHTYFKEVQGEESRSTFFMHRNINRPYHIDYAFVPDRWCDYSFSLEVGEINDWIHLSDHVPLILNIDPQDCRFQDFSNNLYFVESFINEFDENFRQKFNWEIKRLFEIAKHVADNKIDNKVLYTQLETLSKMNNLYLNLLLD